MGILAVFSFEEQPSCSNYLLLYSPLLCISYGYLPLWGSNTKRLSNANCQGCRRVKISGWIALWTFKGSHMRVETGWRIKPVYPHGQRKVPSQAFFKRIHLKILYQSFLFVFFLNFLSSISFTQPASKNTTFRCIFYLCCCLFSLFSPL